MKTILNYIKSIVFWVLNIPLWQIILVGIVCVLGYLGWITYRSCGGGGMKPQPDTPINNIAHFDKRLDAFRASWDIHGRFEAWPSVLPLAEMSKNAYLPENEAKPLFEQYGLTSVVSICSPFHSQCAYVASGEDVLVVVFRGTDDTEDWFFNANTYPRQMPEGSLHCGFGCAYGTVRTQVLDGIKKLAPKHIWVTGHSLGGAMALVCAYDLTVYQGHQIDGVITFGQPKIGKSNLTASLKEKLGDRYVHFINELDAVPQVPPGYSHFGLALQFFHGTVQKSSDYFTKVMKSTPEWKPPDDEYVPIDRLPEMNEQQFQEFLKKHEQTRKRDEPHVRPWVMSGPRTYAMPFPWVDDHSMDRYVEKIRAAIDKAAGH
jgi:triacylglycerol lipase